MFKRLKQNRPKALNNNDMYKKASKTDHNRTNAVPKQDPQIKQIATRINEFLLQNTRNDKFIWGKYQNFKKRKEYTELNKINLKNKRLAELATTNQKPEAAIINSSISNLTKVLSDVASKSKIDLRRRATLNWQ